MFDFTDIMMLIQTQEKLQHKEPPCIFNLDNIINYLCINY